MPTYDYVCKSCDHAWELFQSIKAAPVRKCPECGKSKAQRVIGPGAGIIFKGSGFYQTDYRSDSYRKRAEADKAAGGGNGKADSSTAAETKIETKATDSKSTKPKAKPAGD
jgi:putative FmdB family regulatory protein